MRKFGLRLKDVMAYHQARYAGQSDEADLALARMESHFGHRPDASLQGSGHYLAYCRAIKPLEAATVRF